MDIDLLEDPPNIHWNINRSYDYQRYENAYMRDVSILSPEEANEELRTFTANERWGGISLPDWNIERKGDKFRIVKTEKNDINVSAYFDLLMFIKGKIQRKNLGRDTVYLIGYKTERGSDEKKIYILRRQTPFSLHGELYKDSFDIYLPMLEEYKNRYLTGMGF